MKIKLYTTNSANNVIGKVLKNEVEYDVQFKQSTDIENPMVVLKSDDIILANYAYIEHFGRYYFVDKIELFPNSIYNIYLKCDVLESYKDELLKCQGYISQQKNVNSYFDSGFKSEVRKEVTVYKSNVTLEDTNTIILSAIGG